jgi:flagellar basal body rod protein FlgF
MEDRLRLLKETVQVRENAEGLLRALTEAQAQSEAFLAQSGQRDHLRVVTGKSSLDNAIASTKRMIETLNRQIAQFQTAEIMSR